VFHQSHQEWGDKELEWEEELEGEDKDWEWELDQGWE